MGRFLVGVANPKHQNDGHNVNVNYFSIHDIKVKSSRAPLSLLSLGTVLLLCDLAPSAQGAAWSIYEGAVPGVALAWAPSGIYMECL